MRTDPEKTKLLKSPQEKLDGMTTYIDGKMKRLNLLFAVNGGAFILAKLIFEKGAINHLTLKALAIGAIIFTILMTIDTWRWGDRMRKLFPKEDKQAIHWWNNISVLNPLFADDKLVFTLGGKAILLFLALIIVLAWILAVWS